MNRKKTATWTDFMGSSSLPSDEMTFSTANNYGLDGYQFDTPYGEGVADAARLPETKGLSGLPDGIVTSAEPDLDMQELTEDDTGLDLASMLSEDEGGLAKDAAVIDLKWLDPDQEQDPNRLPNNEQSLDSVSQLEGAWGVNRTDGLHLIPNKDRKPQTGGESHKTAEDVQDAVRAALRQAHYRVPLHEIRWNLRDTLGPDAHRARQAMDIIADEYGLLGNVFVRASAFPGIKNGKWVKEIRKVARTARYVITDDSTIADKLGMEMVDEVPWRDAVDHYVPRLRAAGYHVASGTPRELIRKAFLRGPETVAPNETYKPVAIPVVANAEEVAEALAAPVTPHVAVRTSEQQATEGKRRRALVQIAKWVREGSLTHKDAMRLHESLASPEAILRTASLLVTAHKRAASYTGEGTRFSQDDQVDRQAAWSSLEDQEMEVRKAMENRLMSYMNHVVKAGLLTSDEASRIWRSGRSPQGMERLITAAVQMAHQYRKASLPVPDFRTYVATEFQAFVPERRVAVSDRQLADLAVHIQQRKESQDWDRALAARKAKPVEVTPSRKYAGTVYTEKGAESRKPTALAHEIKSMLKWARLKMTEGSAGIELDQLMSARWSETARKAGAKDLKKARATYEGLSGHLYVDAAVYASPTGVTGCENGALKHRANALKYVMAMDRCATCTLAQTRSDGRSVCSKYNKILALENPVDDPKTYQRDMIRMANASDAETTASLFSPSEFSLKNGSLEDIDFDGAPSTEKLGEVLFGGIEL